MRIGNDIGAEKRIENHAATELSADEGLIYAKPKWKHREWPATLPQTMYCMILTKLIFVNWRCDQ